MAIEISFPQPSPAVLTIIATIAVIIMTVCYKKKIPVGPLVLDLLTLAGCWASGPENEAILRKRWKEISGDERLFNALFGVAFGSVPEAPAECPSFHEDRLSLLMNEKFITLVAPPQFKAERVPRDGEIAPKTRNFFMDLDDETDIAFTVRSGGTVPVMLKWTNTSGVPLYWYLHVKDSTGSEIKIPKLENIVEGSEAAAANVVAPGDLFQKTIKLILPLGQTTSEQSLCFYTSTLPLPKQLLVGSYKAAKDFIESAKDYLEANQKKGWSMSKTLTTRIILMADD